MLVGAVAALIAVAFGAFGAHGLRGRMSPDMLAVFETAVRYQMYHSFAILITALALTGMTGLGAITPIGGLAFLAGWACFIVAAI